jgi:hypothetical protein
MFIFKDVTPIYLKVNFLKWCEIALAQVAASRQLEAKVIKHMQSEFLGLINAVYCVAASMENEEKLDENFHYYIDNYYRKDVQKVNPFEFALLFFKGIKKESARSIIWLLMEVVAAQKDKYDYQKEQKDILNLYERFSGVVCVAYDWTKATQKYKRSKQNGSKITKKKKR